MESAFKKLIKREFGKKKYFKYFESYKNASLKKNMLEGKIENAEIFLDIYEKLKNEKNEKIEEKQKKLSDTLYSVIRINRGYLFVTIAYIIATILIIILELVPTVTIATITLISIAFLYKTYEFVINKFSFIDAHIVLVYKSVLDKITLKYHNRKDN